MEIVIGAISIRLIDIIQSLQFLVTDLFVSFVEVIIGEFISVQDDLGRDTEENDDSADSVSCLTCPESIFRVVLGSSYFFINAFHVITRPDAQSEKS